MKQISYPIITAGLVIRGVFRVGFSRLRTTKITREDVMMVRMRSDDQIRSDDLVF